MTPILLTRKQTKKRLEPDDARHYNTVRNGTRAYRGARLPAAFHRGGTRADHAGFIKETHDMTLQQYNALMKKLLAGEEISEQEKTDLATFDFDKALNSAQAEARRKAEKEALEAKTAADAAIKKIQDYEAQQNASKSESEKLVDQIKALTQRLDSADAETKRLKEESAAQARSAKIRELAEKHGVKFIPGLDHKLLMQGFEASLSALQTEELENEASVKPLIETFRAVNAAAIVAPDAPGVGAPPRKGTLGRIANPWAKDSFNLTEAIRLETENPALAASLKQAAGYKE